MYWYLTRLSAIVCAATVTLGITKVATAGPRPPFAGSYQLTQISDDGPQVQVKVQFTLLNPGNADVKGGILVLMDSQPNSALIGKVATISVLPHLGQKDVSETFSVSKAEYTRWLQGHQPRFDFLVPSGSSAVSVPVQARPIVQTLTPAN